MGPDLALFLPLLIVLGAFMFFASRRQKKAMQATIDLHESLEVGDRVHTTSGMEATIVGVDADTVELEIAPGVVTTWMKLAVRDVIEPDDADDDDEVDDELHEYEADVADDAYDVQSDPDRTRSPKTDS